MSDWIEQDGKRYFEKGYLEMANNTAKRRGDRIKVLEAMVHTSRMCGFMIGFGAGTLLTAICFSLILKGAA